MDSALARDSMVGTLIDDTVVRPHRTLLTLLLSLLMLGMQLQAQVHALEHVGEMLRHSADHSVVPIADTCATCALFAGGANAIGCNAPQSQFAFAAAETPLCSFASFASAAPSYYLSRAPPSLL
jgi:hypothetical protein